MYPYIQESAAAIGRIIGKMFDRKCTASQFDNDESLETLMKYICKAFAAL